MSKGPIIKLAYADDHQLVRRTIMGHILQEGNFRFVLEAIDGLDLIRQLRAVKQLPDICILDLYMPQMDGFATMRELRRYWPAMKVLVLTGNETEFAVIKMIGLGIHGYLSKNCGPAELGKALQDIYCKGIYYSNQMTMDFFEAVTTGKRALPHLKEKEEVFLSLACSDRSYTQIADEMVLTNKQVEWLRTCLFDKFNVMSRSGMVMFAIRSGLIPVDLLSPVLP